MGFWVFLSLLLSKLLHRSVTTKQTIAICKDSVLLAGRRGGVEGALRRGLSCRAGCSDERQLNQSWLKEDRCFFSPSSSPLSPYLPAYPTPHPASKKPPPWTLPSPLARGYQRGCTPHPKAKSYHWHFVGEKEAWEG